MPRSFLKVTLKPDHRSQEEFQVVVNGSEYESWKTDKSIPLADVVDSFDVFVTLNGSQGIMGRASKQQLENAFPGKKEIDVLQQILETGNLISSTNRAGFSSTNDSQAGGYSVSRGSSGGFGGR